MNKEIKAKWLAALRSGKYVHGKGQLKDVTTGHPKHCCLGVLCEVLLEQRQGSWTVGKRFDFEGDSRLGAIPEKLARLRNLQDATSALIELNDNAENYEPAIKYIEDNY